MGLILSSENVVDFLKEHKICPLDFQPVEPAICKESKNFNLVVKSSDLPSLIVKQNRVDSQGNMSHSLITEWIVQEMIDNFARLAVLKPLVSQLLWFDWDNSAVVLVFYEDYISLDEYYETHKNYAIEIARTVGSNLATAHSATYQQEEQREFLGRYIRLDRPNRQPSFIRKINAISPSIFAEICPDGLDFYRLYQRFPSLNQAVIELYENLQPACLTHNDLTLDNFIIDTKIKLDGDSVEVKPEQLKIIDWEFINWGDPAVDLGMVVSQYLGEWLYSLVVDRNLDLNTTLSLATCPLEKITPSLEAFLQGYLTHFPEIMQQRPDFLHRVVQLAGIGILKRLHYHVGRHSCFHNDAICKLQVAKTLLCEPEQGIKTLFGTTGNDLVRQGYRAA